MFLKRRRKTPARSNLRQVQAVKRSDSFSQIDLKKYRDEASRYPDIVRGICTHDAVVHERRVRGPPRVQMGRFAIE